MLKKIIYIIVAFVFFVACNSSKSNDELNREDSGVLAEVNSKNLYIADLPKFLFVNTDKSDSTSILDNYVTKWIKEEIFAQKAKDVISNINSIDLKVEKYKKELLIMSYDKELLKNIEVDLSEEELLKYYEQHKEFFVFDDIFYEMNYITLPRNTSNLAKIKKSISKGEETHWLMNYCKKNPSKCFIKNKAIKNSKYLKENFNLLNVHLQKSNKYKYQYYNSEDVLIYKIVKVFKKGEIAPFEIVKKEVTRLALHHKKQEYLQGIKEKTYQKAKNDKIFEKHIN